MHDSALVAVLGALKELIEDLADHCWLKGTSECVEVLLHILVEVLKDEEEAVLTVNDILEVDDVGVVFEFLQHSYLADGSARNSVVLVVNLDLLDSYLLLRGQFLC